MREFLFASWHQLFDFSVLVGMRDRLRCPRCCAVGTWKPHGGWLDRGTHLLKRRWLCKWCGHYIDAEQRCTAKISSTRKVWSIHEDGDIAPPKELYEWWPWRG